MDTHCSSFPDQPVQVDISMPQNRAAKRPRGRLMRRYLLLLLTLPVPLIGIANLVKMMGALRYSILLPDLPMTVSWAYLAATGGFWGAVFAICTFGLVRFRPWGRRATLAAVTLYEAYVWLNRLLFAASDYARLTVPRDLVLTLLLLLIIWVPLNLPVLCSEFNTRETDQGEVRCA